MEMIKEVHEWSKSVFGTQSPMRPLIGIAEEIGEYLVAIEQGSQEEVEEEEVEDALADALADAGIFFFDFCGSMGVSLEPTRHQDRMCNNTELFKSYGRLCHVVLKTEQGIRGLGDKTSAQAALNEAASDFHNHLTGFAQSNHGIDLHPLMRKVFDATVSKRTKKTLTPEKK